MADAAQRSGVNHDSLVSFIPLVLPILSRAQLIYRQANSCPLWFDYRTPHILPVEPVLGHDKRNSTRGSSATTRLHFGRWRSPIDIIFVFYLLCASPPVSMLSMDGIDAKTPQHFTMSPRQSTRLNSLRRRHQNDCQPYLQLHPSGYSPAASPY
jgi:hypothetical protein